MSFFTVLGLVLILFAVGIHLSTMASVVLDALVGVFRLLQEPFNQILTAVDNTIAGLTERLRSVFSQDLSWGERAILVAVALFKGVATLLLVYCDYGLVQLTLEAMGFTIGQVTVTSPDRLMALTLTVSAVVWGVVLLDVLGVPHIDWLNKGHERGRRWVLGLLAALALLLILTIVGALGLRRAESVGSASADLDAVYVPTAADGIPADVDLGAFSTDSVDPVSESPPVPETTPAPASSGATAADRFVGVGLPVLLTATSVIAAVGFFHAIAYLAAGCLWVLRFGLSLVQLVLNIALSLVNIAYGLAQSLFHILATAMIGLWNWVVGFEFLKPLRLQPRDLDWPEPHRSADNDQPTPGASEARPDESPTEQTIASSAPLGSGPPAPPDDEVDPASFNPLGI